MPTLLYADSIDTYNVSSSAVRYTNSGLLGVTSVTGRYAGQGLLIFNSGFGESKLTRDLPKLTGKIRCGFDFKYSSTGVVTTGPPPNTMIFGLLTSADVPTAIISSRTSYKLAFGTYPSTIVQESTTLFSWETWYHINVDLNFTTGAVEVYVDDVLEMSGTVSLATSTRFGFLHNAFGFRGTAIDNFYILDMDASANTFTRYRVDVAYPTVTNENGWSLSSGSSAFALVDENILTSGGTIPGSDYLYTSVDTVRASFFMSTPHPGTALGIQLVVAARSLALASYLQAFVEKDSSRDFATAYQPSVSSTWFQQMYVYSVSPFSLSLWEASDMQTHAFGVRLSTGGTEVRVSQILVEKVTAVGVVAACRYYAKMFL